MTEKCCNLKITLAPTALHLTELRAKREEGKSQCPARASRAQTGGLFHFSLLGFGPPLGVSPLVSFPASNRISLKPSDCTLRGGGGASLRFWRREGQRRPEIFCQGPVISRLHLLVLKGYLQPRPTLTVVTWLRRSLRLVCLGAGDLRVLGCAGQPHKDWVPLESLPWKLGVLSLTAAASPEWSLWCV